MKSLIKLKDKENEWLIVDRDEILFCFFDREDNHLSIILSNGTPVYVAYNEENINAIMDEPKCDCGLNFGLTGIHANSCVLNKRKN